jgi:hypothetical protein
MSGANSSNKVALLALFSLIPIFVFVIGNGWATILAPVLHFTEVQAFDRILSYVTGFLFGLVAVVLAWAVASERARLQYERTARFAWIAYLGVLIALSALGTMNWLFKVSETPTFIKESIFITEERLTALQQVAQNGIVLTRTEALKQEQEELKNKLTGLAMRLKGELDASRRQELARQAKAKAEIIALTDAFEAELRNPLKAGCGEVAQGYLKQIQEKLPELRLPSGSCRDAASDVVVKTYSEAIQKGMDLHFGDAGSECVISQPVKDIAAQIEAIIKVPPAALDSGCPAMETVISDTEKAVAKYVDSLPTFDPEEKALVELRDRATQRLGKQVEVLNAVYLNGNSLTKDFAGPVLKEAWSEYRAVRQDLSVAVDASLLAALPENIDDQRIDKIGNIANTLEILISRYDRVSTYPIILAGILFDVILIAFFFRIEVMKGDRRKAVNGHQARLNQILSSLKTDA